MPTWTGALSTDWNTAGNWISPSAVPTAATSAIFTGTPTNNCTTGTSNRLCLSLDTTGYLGTLEIGSSSAGTLTVSGNVTIGNTVGHITGSAFIIMTVTATLDVATGIILPNLRLINAITVTLTRTTNITNLSKGAANLSTINPVSGTMSIIITNGSIQGSAGTLVINTNITVSINGISTYSCTSNIQVNLVLASGATLTLLAAMTFAASVGSIFNVSGGTFNPSTFAVNTPPGNGTLSINMGSNSFYDLLNVAGTTSIVTMLSNINILRDFSVSNTSPFNGAFDITVGRNCGGGTLSNSTLGRKITVTGSFSGSCTYSSLSLVNLTCEVNCLTNGFIFAGTVNLTNASFVYLPTNSGSFSATGSTLVYFGASINMNGSTNSFNIISNSSGVARNLTLLSDVYCVTFGSASSNDIINGSGFFLRISGNANAINNISGTAGLRFVGGSAATWTGINGSTNTLASITIEKTGGAIVSIPNSFTYTGGGVITCTSLVNHTATLSLGNCTINSSVASWNNITVVSTATVTINSVLVINGNLTLSNCTFNGTTGWTCTNLICSTTGSTITLQNSIGYRTTTSVNLLGTNASRITMISNSGSIRAIWTLDQGASQSVVYVNGTRIDSSLGQTIWSFAGALTNTINWGIGSRPPAYGYISMF